MMDYQDFWEPHSGGGSTPTGNGAVPHKPDLPRPPGQGTVARAEAALRAGPAAAEFSNVQVSWEGCLTLRGIVLSASAREQAGEIIFRHLDEIRALANLIEVRPTPDEPLLRAARAALRDSPYSPLRNLDCSCEEGFLAVSGQVGSYFLKQMAQETLLRLPSRGVRNLLSVA
jgi:hypothetical protein